MLYSSLSDNRNLQKKVFLGTLDKTTFVVYRPTFVDIVILILYNIALTIKHYNT